LPARFFVDEMLRLENEIGEQMGQENRKKCAKKDLHVLYKKRNLYVSYKSAKRAAE